MSKKNYISSVESFSQSMHEYGFETDIDQVSSPCGLSKDTVSFISQYNKEDVWLRSYRMKALEYFLSLPSEPKWGNFTYDPVDLNVISFFSGVNKDSSGNISKEDREKLKETYEKLGISSREQSFLLGEEKSNVAIDFVFDSVSVHTTFKEKLKDLGIIFCSISDAFKNYPDLVRKYFGTVVSYRDNYYAALNAAVFSDGTFVYVPKGVRCPMELSTYFRINASNAGQFERTLIVADEDSYVSYLEGCTAPIRNENQLHGAVVEIVLLDRAEVRYSTVQNWWSGTESGVGGVYNFVTKRANCKGKSSRMSWNQVEVGSAITWKYPSCILKGDFSQGTFNSVTVTRGKQKADTGTKMIHIGSNTSSSIIAKGISLNSSENTYRSLVSMSKSAVDSHNYTQCDSLMVGNSCASYTYPRMENRAKRSQISHEASTSKISDEHLFYCMQRTLSTEGAISVVVNGFFRGIIQELPMEFAAEAKKLIEITLEESIG